MHLRKGSYRNLALSRSHSTVPYAGLGAVADEDDEDDYYTLPVRAPPPSAAHAHTPSGSITNFADFVSAPGRSRRYNQRAPPKSARGNLASGKSPAEGADEVEELLFDEDEMSTGSHLKAGTDESASASGSNGRTSAEDDGPTLPSSGSSTRRASRVRM